MLYLTLDLYNCFAQHCGNGIGTQAIGQYMLHVIDPIPHYCARFASKVDVVEVQSCANFGHICVCIIDRFISRHLSSLFLPSSDYYFTGKREKKKIIKTSLPLVKIIKFIIGVN